ncbi:hypothetical protein Nhal_3252 [Nitrosococcus halophilus Nc 4]|uniref:Uncharacterized protein n=1 Tax=Nitrosococcus halophilus (strain Nc4) TaxID=472759 RepID=D5C053_NITHN|nr:hypothetical protein Nhal_3252 [Nitrosococcus halophilus Nc 4]
MADDEVTVFYARKHWATILGSEAFTQAAMDQVDTQQP